MKIRKFDTWVYRSREGGAVMTRLYIVEGLPCSGKSTTAKHIADSLEKSGKKVCFFWWRQWKPSCWLWVSCLYHAGTVQRAGKNHAGKNKAMFYEKQGWLCCSIVSVYGNGTATAFIL